MTAPGPYADLDRAEVEPFIPPNVSPVLDVGCFKGAFGALVKQRRRETEVWGIEPDASAAAAAAARLDRVVVGRFPEHLPNTAFECIVFNDVLEHVVDPWSLLREAQHYLRPEGCIVASVPNVRHYFVLRELMLRGRWDYVDEGILDRTHLRFFTKRSMRSLFEDAGFLIHSIDPVNLETYGRLGRVLGLFGRTFQEFRARQYVVVAYPAPISNQKLPP